MEKEMKMKVKVQFNREPFFFIIQLFSWPQTKVLTVFFKCDGQKITK